MSTYGTPEMVAVELGRPASSVTEVERLRWARWLDRVERRIEIRFAALGLDLAEIIADPSQLLTANAVAAVEVAVVARKAINPEGLTSTTVSIDDGSVTRRREGVDVDASLDLNETEWAELLPGESRRTRVFSVMPS